MAAVCPFLDPGLEPNPLVLEDAIFLHHYSVSAVRHRCSGKDPDRLAAAHRAAKRMARRRPSGDRKHSFPVGHQVAVSDRITVDGTVRMRRKVHRGDDIAREDASGRRRQRHRFGPDNRRDSRFDLRKRLSNSQ